MKIFPNYWPEHPGGKRGGEARNPAGLITRRSVVQKDPSGRSDPETPPPATMGFAGVLRLTIPLSQFSIIYTKLLLAVSIGLVTLGLWLLLDLRYQLNDLQENIDFRFKSINSNLKPGP